MTLGGSLNNGGSTGDILGDLLGNVQNVCRSDLRKNNRQALEGRTLIPQELKDERRWVLWKYEDRGGKPTKVPYTSGGRRASVSNPDDWTSFDTASVFADMGLDYAGIGFVLGDGFFGVDLDNCRNPETGAVAPWAKAIVDDVGSYVEVSPSRAGLKIFGRGEPPVAGRRIVDDGAVEVYGAGRYFTVTGDQFGDGKVASVAPEALQRLADSYFADGGLVKTTTGEATITRCREVLADLPDAVSGQRGHDKTFLAASTILRHGIDGAAGFRLLEEFNRSKCFPPWTPGDLRHKWRDAQRACMIARDFGSLVFTGSEFDDVPGVSPTLPAFDLDIWEVGSFMAADFPQRWLIPGVLIEQECLVIGGPQKSLKTSIAFDLAVSLATGTKFLNLWEPVRTADVLVLTGESGKPTIQRTLSRILAAKSVGPPADRLHVGFNLPQLSRDDHLEALEKAIRARGVELAVIDPAYLCTLEAGKSDSASNVFAMGYLLRRLTAIATATKCIVAVVHHAKRNTKGEPSLGDLSWAGWAEWARQWFLLQPQKPMRDGKHELRLKFGGSAGHFGDYRIDVDEGNNPFEDDATGPVARCWDAKATSWDDDSRGSADNDLAVRNALIDGPLTRARIRTAVGLGLGKVDQSLKRLVDAGVVEAVENPSKKGSFVYQLTLANPSDS